MAVLRFVLGVALVVGGAAWFFKRDAVFGLFAREVKTPIPLTERNEPTVRLMQGVGVPILLVFFGLILIIGAFTG